MANWTNFCKNAPLCTPTSNANATTTTTAGNVLEGSKPFEVLRDLLCHHAHLAVFMNYVISNSDPSALVIYVYLMLKAL